jgi:hypothetical protein
VADRRARTKRFPIRRHTFIVAEQPDRQPPASERKGWDQIAEAMARPTGCPGDVPDPCSAKGWVTRLSDTHFAIDRPGMECALAHPAVLARGARIVPFIGSGRPNGFKVYAIRPSSVYAALGLNNGDTIRAINGIDLSSPDKALQAYARLRDADHMELELTRRGVRMTIVYDIRDAPACGCESGALGAL